MSGEPQVRPPGGPPPPTAEALPDGTTVQLLPLAEEVCRRYRQEFPDEQQRYGDAGDAWCVHDNLYLFDWAVLHLGDCADLFEEVSWLADVLEARNFPLERLARGLDLAAEVAVEQLTGRWGGHVAALMREAAADLRTRWPSEPETGA